jgi:large subunit ribosomal protein L17
MRHLVSGRALSADTQHRLAMRRNLARSLFLRGRVVTTQAKAKAFRPFVERLVTRAKRAHGLKDKDRAAYIHQLRVLRRDVHERAVLTMLVEKIAPLCKDRPGGYTRIVRDARNQLGDNAPRCFLEFVDRPPTEGEDAEAERKGEKKPEKKAAEKKGKKAAAAS